MGYGLGVDLGTTSTAAAVVGGDGRPDTVPLGDRSADVPSAVFLREDGGELIGEAALRRGVAEPHRLAREFKRRLGDPTPLVLGGRPVSAEALTGHLLRWVVDEVRARQGGPPDRVVVAFPANWGPFRREMLAQALAIADVGTVDTVQEPVAAALHLASSQRVPPGGTVAVYDLGGGTFDATVLRDTGAGYEVLGTPGGLEHLGGVDFDEAVFAHVTGALGDDLADLDVDDADVTRGLSRLRQECTAAKEHLSSDTEATVHVELPGVRRDVRITRPEFEDLVRPSVGETVACLRRALRSADVEPDQLAAVVLVGGSVRIPLVTQVLGHDLGRPVTLSPSPKHAVALGAALVAAGTTSRPRPAPATTPAPVPADAPVPSPAAGRGLRPPRQPTHTSDPPPPGRSGASGASAARPARAARSRPPGDTRVRRLRGLTAGLAATGVLLALVVPLLLSPTPEGWRLEQVSGLDRDGVAQLRLTAPGPGAAAPETLDVDLVLAGAGLGSRRVTVSDGRADLDLSDLESPAALAWLGADLTTWLAGPVRVVAPVPDGSPAAADGAGPCSGYPPLPCADVVVDPTGDGFTLEFDGTEGGLDVDGEDIGFTLTQPSSLGRFRPELLREADGVLRLTTTNGIQFAATNSLDNALGVALPTPEGELEVSTRLVEVPPGKELSEQAGLWLGTDEDDLVKLVAISRLDGRFNLQLQREVDGVTDVDSETVMPNTRAETFPAGSTLDLSLVVDPGARTATGWYGIDGGDLRELGTVELPPGVLEGLDPALEGAGTAAGVFGSKRHRGADDPLVYSFDSFAVTEAAPSTAPDAATVQALVGPQVPYRTITFVLWVLLLLFVVAYAESLLRGIRRRRRARRVDVLGLSAVGALAGVVLVLTGWMTSGLLAVPPARLLAGATVALLVGAGAGVAVLAGERAGRRPVRRGP